MAKRRKDFIKRRNQFFVFIVIILLIILAGFFVYRYFFVSKRNNYLIKNKYYGFELSVPKNWLAEKDESYSEDNIAQLLDQCKNENSKDVSAYEIGDFRFEDQKYPKDVGFLGSVLTGSPSGAILDVAVSCTPGSMKNGISYGYDSLKIGGEKAFQALLNLPVFGNTKYLSFFHNGFQYRINEYVYVSPADKAKDKEIRASYAGLFNNIVSSFKFK